MSLILLYKSIQKEYTIFIIIIGLLENRVGIYNLQYTYLEYRTISGVTNSHHIPNKRQNFTQLQQYMFCCLRYRNDQLENFVYTLIAILLSS